jgi:hypothetical protein
MVAGTGCAHVGKRPQSFLASLLRALIRIIDQSLHHTGLTHQQTADMLAPTSRDVQS